MSNRYLRDIQQMTAQAYWQRLLECGWMVYKSTERCEELRQRIFDAFDTKPENTFVNLIDVGFDAEYIYASGENTSCSYYELLTKFAQGSDGLFQPTRIIDVLDSARWEITVGFELREKVYQCQVRSDTDWFDEGVLTLMNDALGEQGVQPQFLSLPVFDQCALLVFVPPAVYRRAERAGLIPPEKYFWYAQNRPAQLASYVEQYSATLTVKD